jgi:glycine/D-amino acid oxidase-like deaminating enzyme
MPFSPDGVPIVGELPSVHAGANGSLFVITGMAGAGFMSGAEAGAWLARFIASGKSPHPLFETMDPKRFMN